MQEKEVREVVRPIPRNKRFEALIVPVVSYFLSIVKQHQVLSFKALCKQLYRTLTPQAVNALRPEIRHQERKLPIPSIELQVCRPVLFLFDILLSDMHRNLLVRVQGQGFNGVLQFMKLRVSFGHASYGHGMHYGKRMPG